MTENMSDSSPMTKKRKPNDGRATALESSNSGGGGGLFSSRLGRDDTTTPTTSSTTCGGENLIQKMDAMMQMMSRMEESQLATVRAVGSLERRCEKLEAKCSSLEHMLETKTNSIKEHVDSKFDTRNEYNNMLVKNQSWKYSTPVYSEVYWENNGYDEDVAIYLTESSDCLKECTEKMRQGEFPSGYSDGRKGIELDWPAGVPGGVPIFDDDAIINMSPHWEEFAKALKQFGPVFGMLPDGCETYFILENIQLPGNVPRLLKDALMHKPFQNLCLVNKTGVRGDEGMSLEDILDIVDSNKHLRKLRIGNNRIQPDDIAKICSAVLDGSIVELDLYNCFESNVGDEMISSLLTSGGLAKLERLGMASNGLQSSTITTLANFLATNPPLQKLDLEYNGLVDNDANALSNALRSNTTLRRLDLGGNYDISHAGDEAFDLVCHNDSSINSIADSNHRCSVVGLYQSYCWNVDETYENRAWHVTPSRENRARKIYRLLSARNTSTSISNVQDFSHIDVKLLPSILEAVQRYASVVHPDDSGRLGYSRVKPLSIVYEVMRKWDKVFPLYNSVTK